MKRRDFITLLSGAAVWPLVARAQQGERVRRIGAIIVDDENDPVMRSELSAFTQALAGMGWTDGHNVRMDLRSTGDENRMRALARELVGLQPDIIVTYGGLPALAVQRETRTIPIIFMAAADPVALRIVARLDRPGGNITGFASFVFCSRFRKHRSCHQDRQFLPTDSYALLDGSVSHIPTRGHSRRNADFQTSED